MCVYFRDEPARKSSEVVPLTTSDAIVKIRQLTLQLSNLSFNYDKNINFIGIL